MPVMGKVFFTALLIMGIVMVESANAKVEIDLSIIAEIESGGNPRAFNTRSGACGLYQITAPALSDYNTFGPGKNNPLTLKDMFDPLLCEVVADWYINVRIPALLKHYGYADTINNRLRAYNAGVRYCDPRRALPLETKNYIKKYHARAGR